MMLYPLKFKPIYSERVWGGDKIKKYYLASAPDSDKIGEAWLLSGLEGEESEVSNGYLIENTVNELIEVYMSEMVGEKVYDTYNAEFPILIKIIDAREKLSVQVHPNDDLAKKRHNAYGKSELWYIMKAEDNASIFLGFKESVSASEYNDAVAESRVEQLLNEIEVKEGDIYFIPAGTVHAIGKGVMLAEVQQTSDITYRIYDWGRKNEGGNERELHIDLASDAINYKRLTPQNLRADYTQNAENQIHQSKEFNLSIREVEGVSSLQLYQRDSFTILLCVEGCCEIEYDIDGMETLGCGEVILLPLELEEINIYGDCRLLEVYI